MTFRIFLWSPEMSVTVNRIYRRIERGRLVIRGLERKRT
jgi:hypothetical protein